jgi:hypothetical protein
MNFAEEITQKLKKIEIQKVGTEMKLVIYCDDASHITLGFDTKDAPEDYVLTVGVR